MVKVIVPNGPQSDCFHKSVIHLYVLFSNNTISRGIQFDLRTIFGLYCELLDTHEC